jgi:hypothetical protein
MEMTNLTKLPRRETIIEVAWNGAKELWLLMEMAPLCVLCSCSEREMERRPVR